MDQYPEQQVVVATGLSKQFTLGDTVVHALRGVDINVANEEFVAILGASVLLGKRQEHLAWTIGRPGYSHSRAGPNLGY